MPVKFPAMRMLGMVLGLFLSCGYLTAADSHPPLPAEVAMNAEAGRGGSLMVKLRLADGEELPMIVDTGSPGIWLDKSLIPKLGKKFETVSIRTFNGQVKGGLYAAPKFYLGGVQLETGRIVAAGDLSKVLPHLKPIKGIIGMDCLRRYCVQLDFQSNTVRFLDPAHLDKAGLGKSYPLKFAWAHGWYGEPVIQHAGLLGGTTTNVVIDTGNEGDGMAKGRAIRQHAKGSYSGGLIKRTKHFLAVQGWANHPVGSLNCMWDGNAYTNVTVGRGPKDQPNWIGLGFLARHLVTFDFPSATMYLKQTSSGPLEEKGKATDTPTPTEPAAASPSKH